MESMTELKIQDVFNIIKPDLAYDIPLESVLEKIEKAGIYDLRDPRLTNLKEVIRDIGGKAKCYYEIRLDLQSFAKIINTNKALLLGALLDNLVLPKFQEIIKKLKYYYEVESSNIEGEISEHVSVLTSNPKESWGVAICSIDGQRCFMGKTELPFKLHALSKPFIYAMAMDKLGPGILEKHIAHETVHTMQDFLNLDLTGRPRNVVLDSGFLMLCSILFGNKTYKEASLEHQKGLQYLNGLAANEFLQHRTQTFIAAKNTGNHALAVINMLVAEGKISPNWNLSEACDFLYEVYSMEVNCESLSIMAATLANGGINPLTLEEMMNPLSVKYTLTSMLGSGIYTSSGKSAFLIGQPGKSSKGGAMFYVIPGVMGIALYSPKIDRSGNSVRGFSYMQSIVKELQLHPFANTSAKLKKMFPAKKTFINDCNTYCEIFSALAAHDICKVVRLAATNGMAYYKDHDKRSLLHVAAALGYHDIVLHLVTKYSTLVNEKDRFRRFSFVWSVQTGNRWWEKRVRQYKQARNYKIQWGRTAMDYAKFASCSQMIVDMLADWETLMVSREESVKSATGTTQSLKNIQ